MISPQCSKHASSNHPVEKTCHHNNWCPYATLKSSSSSCQMSACLGFLSLSLSLFIDRRMGYHLQSILPHGALSCWVSLSYVCALEMQATADEVNIDTAPPLNQWPLGPQGWGVRSIPQLCQWSTAYQGLPGDERSVLTWDAATCLNVKP